MASPKPSPRSTDSSRSLAGKRVLVIDGGRSEGRRLLEFLSGWGISVQTTASPLHGLALLWSALEAKQPFHLTLFGPQNQGVPGEQFAALVGSEPRLAKMPMLHLGDSAGSLRKAAIRRAGFFDTVSVPIDKTSLFNTLHRACGNLVTSTGVVRLADRHAALGPLTPRLDILLAEPNPEQRRIVRSTLATGGHHIFEVDSGEQTIAALTKHSFDLVILTMDLPGISTAEALKLLPFLMTRDAWPACIGLARGPSTSQARDFANAGIAATIPSPVQPQALLEAIADVIRGTDDKLPAWERLRASLGLTARACAHIGDDLPDVPLLRACGLAASVPHAPDEVRRHAHYVTRRDGGHGAARELAELILAAQGFRDRDG